MRPNGRCYCNVVDCAANLRVDGTGANAYDLFKFASRWPCFSYPGDLGDVTLPTGTTTLDTTASPDGSATPCATSARRHSRISSSLYPRHAKPALSLH